MNKKPTQGSFHNEDDISFNHETISEAPFIESNKNKYRGYYKLNLIKIWIGYNKGT